MKSLPRISPASHGPTLNAPSFPVPQRSRRHPHSLDYIIESNGIRRDVTVSLPQMMARQRKIVIIHWIRWWWAFESSQLDNKKNVQQKLSSSGSSISLSPPAAHFHIHMYVRYIETVFPILFIGLC